MILSREGRSSKALRSEGWLLGALLAGLFMALAYVLLHYSGAGAALTVGDAISCDAERVRGERFINGRFEFEKGEQQSGEVARSGWFSCRVPAGEGVQYGFSYRLQGVAPGEVYRATVWRYKNILNEGKLAVNGSTAKSLYDETDEVRDRQGDWEQLSITFHIPYRSEMEWVNIYVYTNGYQPVFFDDLQIERIDLWEENDFQPQTLALRIGPDGRRELADKRRAAIREGVLFTDSGDWVDGQILRDTAAAIPVRLRLKGDWLDHLAGDKWSYRLKVRDPYHWNHLKVFSLHTPAARYHLHEWVLHRLWEREDVLTTRYDLTELSINGESKGIYAYEEHFTKQLLESRRRREGPILKWDEGGLWLANQRQLAANGYVPFGHEDPAAAWKNADLAAFDEEDLLADTLLGPMVNQAKGLLTAYLEGELPAGQVFDLDRLAAYYAACDVLNGYHGIVWHNQRFYFNPVTALLEPIGFDAFGGPPPDGYTFLGEGALHPQAPAADNLFAGLARDTAFLTRYVRQLYRYSDRTFFEPFLDSLRADWTARRQWLRMEFPGYEVRLRDFRARARYVHSRILPYEGQSLKARRLAGAPERILVENTHTLPVELVGWSRSSKDNYQPLDRSMVLPGQPPRLYLSRLRGDSLQGDFARFRFLEDQALQQQSVPLLDTISVAASARYLFYRPLGLDTLFAAALGPQIVSTTPAVAALFRGSQLPERPYYRVEGKKVLVYPGTHRATDHLYIRAGYQVTIPAGTSLDLVQGAAFVSRSPVFAMGDADAPIRIHSSDGTGNGFSVLEAPATSVFKQVDFQGLTTLTAGGSHLTGAVNFHESAVRFYRCRFAEARCEDALNIIRSEFQLDGCLFQDTYSDAFDSDFSKGEIRNCAFLNTGNDGLDVSGSIVNVFECRFDTNGDKGISVGEASDLTVFNSSFRNALIALASKDESVLYARNVTLEHCEQGFAAYQKKPEYGGATILVEGYKASEVRRLFVEGEGSRVTID